MSKEIRKNLYTSIKMLHPDGTVMCMVSERKRNWYIRQGLAEALDDNFFKLKFNPNGYGNSNKQFYLEEKYNHCVVCKKTDNLSRHHVVPYQFRRLLPLAFKASDHHDIVLLCRKHHDAYEHHADKLKDKIYDSLGFDIKNYNRIVSNNYNIVKAQNTLLQYGKSMPEKAISKLIEVASKLKTEVPNWQTAFVEKYNTENSISEFCSMWRKHFIQYAKPQYLSSYFDVDHVRHE